MYYAWENLVEPLEFEPGLEPMEVDELTNRLLPQNPGLDVILICINV